VQASNRFGYSEQSAWTPRITIAGGSLPQTPGAFTARINADNSVQLTWQDLSNNETGFKIKKVYQKPDNSVYFYNYINLPANTISLKDNPAPGEQIRYYTIQSCNENGCSPESAQAIPE